MSVRDRDLHHEHHLVELAVTRGDLEGPQAGDRQVEVGAHHVIGAGREDFDIERWDVGLGEFGAHRDLIGAVESARRRGDVDVQLGAAGESWRPGKLAIAFVEDGSEATLELERWFRERFEV